MLGSRLATSDETVCKAFTVRKADSRKGENGVVAVIGGSRLYHGAPCLSALAAQRVGIDLVYLAVPREISIPIRAMSPNFIVIPLPDDKLTIGCVNKLLKWLPDVDAVVLGPGSGKQKSDGMKHLIGELVSKGVKMLLDADALKPELITKLNDSSVITPHAGEFKRIFDIELDKSFDSRVQIVTDMAEKSGLTILLKGRVDIISDGKQVALNHTGTSAMTVGGTGDVLSGVVAGLMARGANPFEASAAGAYVNGLAGELATKRLGFHITATDVIDDLPHVLKKFDREIE